MQLRRKFSLRNAICKGDPVAMSTRREAVLSPLQLRTTAANQFPATEFIFSPFPFASTKLPIILGWAEKVIFVREFQTCCK